MTGKEVGSMPIYEYQCAACGDVVEKWQTISETPLTMCPSCGGSLSKLISACAFHLKGSGWYVSDYAGKSPATNCDADNPVADAPAAKDTTAKDAAAGEKCGSAPSKIT
jgi:putative FmdB family regulatory protein